MNEHGWPIKSVVWHNKGHKDDIHRKYYGSGQPALFLHEYTSAQQHNRATL